MQKKHLPRSKAVGEHSRVRHLFHFFTAAAMLLLVSAEHIRASLSLADTIRIPEVSLAKPACPQQMTLFQIENNSINFYVIVIL